MLPCLLMCACGGHDRHAELRRSLRVQPTRPFGQVELGSPFVGIEMHRGIPMLNRISFYSPVANSIDASSDYWTRDQVRVMGLGLKIGDGPRVWIEDSPWEYELTPYDIHLSRTAPRHSLKISYEFTRTWPALVAITELTNLTGRATEFELFTQLEMSVRTSHTYHLEDRAATFSDPGGSALYARYDEVETGAAEIFLANAGEPPASFTTDGDSLGRVGNAGHAWIRGDGALPGRNVTPDRTRRPVGAFTYVKNLDPGEGLRVVQLIGSAKGGQGRAVVKNLLDHYAEDVARRELELLDEIHGSPGPVTGDRRLDHTSDWAKGILATSRHYLDGEIVPMPCPAQYNFYFTHDVLVTDLAAVNFDIERVANDLAYVVAHANTERIIPHAYYWKDDRYVTEYAQSDNWNHLWFVLASASYLRHSGDSETLRTLYPFMSKSVTEALKNLGDDHLMRAGRPDWWDIGKSYGPRSYTTILTIRALQEYVYVSSVLGERSSALGEIEARAQAMRKALSERLWNEDVGYFMDVYGDGTDDPHVYMGPLLAATFNLTPPTRKRRLVETASRRLLDPELGIYNVVPMDFHELGDKLGFKGNEAGARGVYFNGGIWFHGNAWYALAQIAVGRREDAADFIRHAMTLDGISRSPNGYPAMYEYRMSRTDDPKDSGSIDKPQFLWAGGWYLLTVYNLLGLREDPWNLALEPFVLPGQERASFSFFAHGKELTVQVEGSGETIRTINYDGRAYPSTVIPASAQRPRRIDVRLGEVRTPYLARTSAALLKASHDPEASTLSLVLEAFKGHRNTTTTIVAPERPRVTVLNQRLRDDLVWAPGDGKNRWVLSFTHELGRDALEIGFQGAGQAGEARSDEVRHGGGHRASTASP